MIKQKAVFFCLNCNDWIKDKSKVFDQGWTLMDQEGFLRQGIGNVENGWEEKRKSMVVNLLHCTFLLMQLMGAPVTCVNSILTCFHVNVT